MNEKREFLKRTAVEAEQLAPRFELAPHFEEVTIHPDQPGFQIHCQKNSRTIIIDLNASTGELEVTTRIGHGIPKALPSKFAPGDSGELCAVFCNHVCNNPEQLANALLNAVVA